MPFINCSGLFLISCKKLHLVISQRMIFDPSLISACTSARWIACLNLKISKLITSNGIVLPLASIVFDVFCVIFAISIEMIVVRTNVYEFVFKTKIDYFDIPFLFESLLDDWKRFIFKIYENLKIKRTKLTDWKHMRLNIVKNDFKVIQ